MALTPSQRVSILKQIAARLGSEDYSLIDLTLKQFALPRTDTWSGTKEDYVLKMTEDAGDDPLLDLARHVGAHVEQSTLRVDPPFWQPGMFRVFLSHLATKRKLAAQLQEALLEYDISCFVAHNDIEPTSEWMAQIETALSTCEALVALMHPDFHKSNWTDQEIGFAMGRGVPTFAIRFGQDPYGFVGRFQAFNGEGKEVSTLASELFNAYRKNKQTQKRMAEVLVGRFELSASYADAKKKIGHLEELEVWDPSFSKRIVAAQQSNNQIADSWRVPDRIKALVSKWKKAGL